MAGRLAILAIVLLVLVLSWGRLGSIDLPAGMPVEELAASRDRPQPPPGLTGPLPAWIPLPAHGRVVTAGRYPPQPPYGAAASVTIMTDQTAAEFAAAYRARLELAGFTVRVVPPRFNIIFDEPELLLEAIEAAPRLAGGHVIYVALRRTQAGQFAQITCWDPPAPRL